MPIVVDSTDIEAVWRPLSEAEAEVAEAWLGVALRRAYHEFPTLDARIAAGQIDGDLVRDVIVGMVLRYARNPEGKRQESIEDYSFTREVDTAKGEILLTDGERSLLAPPGTRSGAFSITPAMPRGVRVYQNERAGVYVRPWLRPDWS